MVIVVVVDVIMVEVFVMTGVVSVLVVTVVVVLLDVCDRSRGRDDSLDYWCGDGRG